MLKGAVLLVAALTIVKGASIRDGDWNCVAGPEWWCKDEANAQACGATQYCTEYVWETKGEVAQEVREEEDKSVKDSSMKCAVCEYVAGAVLKELEKNSTEAEILSILEEVCEKIPEVGAQCAEYVKEFGPELIKTLEEMVSADAICESLKLCSPALERFTKDNKLVKYLSGVQNKEDDQCMMCTDGLLELQTVLKDEEMLAVITAIINVFCTAYPMPQCQTLMNSYTKKYIAVIESWDVKNECTTLGICKAKGLSIPAPAVSDDECDACKDGVQEVKDILMDKDTLALLKIAANELCKIISVPLCPTLADALIQQAIAQVEAMDPKAMCTEMGACEADFEPIVPNLPPVVPNLPPVVLNLPAVLTSVTVPIQDDGCDACVAGFDEIKTMLTDDDTVKLMKIAMHEFCLLVESSLCEKIMDLLVDNLITDLKALEPLAICQDIGACPSTIDYRVETEECDACVDGIDEIKNILLDNDTLALIEIAINELCAVFGVPAATCSLVTELLPDLIDQISKLDPKAVCVEFGACAALGSVNDGSFSCEYCEFVGEQVMKRLINNKTETIILNAAKKVCSVLPLGSEKCLALVDKYGYIYIEELRNKINFQLICQKLKMCDPEIKKFVESLGLIKVLTDEEYTVETDECDACVDGIDEIKNILLDNDTQSLIEIAVSELCAVLGVPSCQEIAKLLITELLDQVAKLDPKAVCVEFGACTADLGSVNDGSFSCEYCEFVGNQIINRLFNNETEALVLDMTKKVCAELPEVISNECSALVDEYGYYYLNELRKSLDVENLCEKFKMCDPAVESLGLIKVLTDEESSDGLVCDLCTEGLTDAQSYLQSADGQALIKSSAMSICELVKLPGCELVVDSFMAALNKELSSFEPKTACIAFTMCPAPVYPLQDSADFQEFSLTQSFQCDLCKFIGNETVERLLTYKTITEVLAIAHKGCSYLPFISEECAEFIEDDGEDLIYKFISYINIDKICSKIKLCSPASLQQDLTSQSFLCDTCEFFGHEIIDRLLTNDTRSATLSIARKACSVIPLFSVECQNFIDDEGQYYLDLWISKIDIDILCTKLKLCSPEFKTWYETSTIPTLIIEADVDCDTCVDGFDELKKILKDPYTKDFIIVAVRQACTSLPIPFCNTVMDKIVNNVLATVEAINSQAECVKLGVCPASQEDMIADLKSTTVVADICDDCVEGINGVKEVIADPDTKIVLKAVVDEVCVTLRIPLCKYILDSVLDKFIDSIAAVDANKTCQLFDLCDAESPINGEEMIQSLVDTVSVGSVGCDMCCSKMDEFKEMVADPAVVSGIKKGVDELCMYIPIIGPMCKATLDSYIDAAAKAVLKLDSRTTCSLFGLC